MSPYSPVAALKPRAPLPSLTSATMTEDSSPALDAICLSGDSSALLAMLIPTF